MQQMVNKMLAKVPEDRPTAEDLVNWVETLMPNEGEDTYKLKLNLSPPTIEEMKEEANQEERTECEPLDGVSAKKQLVVD